MLRSKSFKILPLVLLLLAGTACTNDALDDGGSADVVLEVESLENPAVTASLDATTGFCTFTVNTWKFGARALPKNPLATGSNFNDISLISVTIDYAWIGGAVTPTRLVGLGGVVVPVGETAQVEFSPIAFDDLSLALSSSTANLTMTFDAITIEGTRITQVVLRQLHVEACA